MQRTGAQFKLSWSLGELAAATGLSVGLLRKEIRRGALRVRRVGRRLVVLHEDWQAYTADETTEGGTRPVIKQST
jgi:hypothetical protein